MTHGSDALAELATSIADLKSTILDAQTVKVAPATLANLVELAILRTHSLLEEFIQEIFYLALLADPSVPGNGATLRVQNREEADLLLLSSGARTEKFLSWLPLERTLDMSDKYLLEGSPFDRLRYRHTERRLVNDLVTVRNAVAHPSDDAKAQFVELARNRSYPAGRPADYLLSTRGGSQEVLLLMTQSEIIARGLLASSESEAAGILQPESEFIATQKAPAGVFECTRCFSRSVRPVGGKIGPCVACEPLTACPHCSRVPVAQTKWRRVIES